MRTYKHGFSITPSDAGNLAVPCNALYVGGTGNVNCILYGDSANTLFVGLPAGTLLPVKVLKIWTTGTSATNLVGVN